MTSGKIVAAALLISAQALAGMAESSILNTLNTDTGDFGGASLTVNRDQFESFVDMDNYGNVDSYGFYTPPLGTLNLQNQQDPIGIALDFDQRFNLTFVDQMPYHFVGIKIHPEASGVPAHIESFLWLAPKETALGIQCEGSTPESCQSTSYLAQRFARTPNADFYPAGYVNRPENWLPGLGARLLPDPLPSNPSAHTMFGSYNGQLIFHGTKVTLAVAEGVTESTPRSFAWPSTRRYPKLGRFFTQFRVSRVGDRLRFEFRNLEENSQCPIISSFSAPSFTGEPFQPLLLSVQNIVSNNKDCSIRSGRITDGGWTIVSSEGIFCCRDRGDYDSATGFCTRNTCTGTADLASPPDAFLYSTSDSHCYSKCFAQAADA